MHHLCGGAAMCCLHLCGSVAFTHVAALRVHKTKLHAHVASMSVEVHATRMYCEVIFEWYCI